MIFFPSFSVPNGQSMLGSFRSILAKTPKKSKEWQSDQREIHKARYANVFSSSKFPFYTHKREGLKYFLNTLKMSHSLMHMYSGTSLAAWPSLPFTPTYLSITNKINGGTEPLT